MKKHTAFSAYELSLVIVIIGLLMVGTVKGFSMVNASRLQSAQALTLSSPVANIKGLSLWLETTLEDSFLTTEAYDGTQLTTWKDINPQATTRYTATATASSGITYKTFSDIYKVPAIYFNGTNTAVLALTDVVGATPLFTPDNAFSFFIVSKISDGPASNKIIFSNGDASAWGFGLVGSQGSRTRRFIFTGGSDVDSATTTASTSPEVISATYEGGTSGAIKLFTNGAAETLASSTATAPSPTTGFYIGNKSLGSPWTGYIAEIIIFKRVLSDYDRKQVEKYLGQKYGIRVVS